MFHNIIYYVPEYPRSRISQNIPDSLTEHSGTQNVPEYSRIFQNVPEYSRIFQNVQNVNLSKMAPHINSL
jgi:hypothetical protein